MQYAYHLVHHKHEGTSTLLKICHICYAFPLELWGRSAAQPGTHQLWLPDFLSLLTVCFDGFSTHIIRENICYQKQGASKSLKVLGQDQ